MMKRIVESDSLIP